MAQPLENTDSHNDVNWFEDWFDEDYLKLYSNRDEGEAEIAVENALRLAPCLAKGKILDLGCGTGRHLCALRQVNQDAFGIDLSKTMLDHAKEKLSGNLIRADMRYLPIAASSLDGACLWFTPFGYFSREANAALLQSLARVIKQGGALLIDFFNSNYLLSTFEAQEQIEMGGALIKINRVVNGERIDKRIKITKDDYERDIIESVQLYSPGELEKLICDSGFRFVKCWGNYQGDEFDINKSKRFISLWKRL
jgi:SAM-dependent methyltransferase